MGSIWVCYQRNYQMPSHTFFPRDYKVPCKLADQRPVLIVPEPSVTFVQGSQSMICRGSDYCFRFEGNTLTLLLNASWIGYLTTFHLCHDMYSSIKYEIPYRLQGLHSPGRAGLISKTALA